MTGLEAILVIESDDADDHEVLEAWQALYDSGLWENLQGFYQRTMISLLEAGAIND